MTIKIGHWCCGDLVQTPDTSALSVSNPATGEKIAEVHIADAAMCDKAVRGAKEAFQSWSIMPANKRAAILFEFRSLLKKHQKELAELVTLEHGKTFDDAMGSVARGIEVVEHHCSIANQLSGHISTEVAGHIDCYTIRQPLGVCAGVSPFNFPVMVPIWMMIPAIACGNTFILKPSEQDPSAPMRLMELLKEAGLPDGVVQCLHGNKETVDHLLHHPDIQAITAVASTPVAEYIYSTATKLGKRSHTFGGAKNHALVMPDAGMEYTANAITGAAFGSAGERCMALSAVVCVGDQTADALIDALKPRIEAIRIDAGHKQGADMGPLISAAHRERVVAAIDKGVAEGATLCIDGRNYQHHEYTNGFFLGPSLFDHVQSDMSVYRHEIFGPVLVVLRVDSLEEGIRLINQNAYGNGTAIFTKDGFTAREFSQKVQVGMVGINVPIPVPVATHPFGGWKRSAFGDTNMHGEESIHFYTRRKSITSRWPVNVPQGNAFVMPTHD